MTDQGSATAEAPAAAPAPRSRLRKTVRFVSLALLVLALVLGLLIAFPPVGFFKDTSLVAIIGIFDLLGAARAVVVDPRWLRSAATVYLFVAAVYFLFCYVMSHGSRRLEAWWRAREAR